MRKTGLTVPKELPRKGREKGRQGRWAAAGKLYCRHKAGMFKKQRRPVWKLNAIRPDIRGHSRHAQRSQILQKRGKMIIISMMPGKLAPCQA